MKAGQVIKSWSSTEKAKRVFKDFGQLPLDIVSKRGAKSQLQHQLQNDFSHPQH